jgi:hypothetical protein
LKEISKQMMVNWAASGGEIDALEWAWDQGIHGDAELCIWAAFKGHLLACVAMAPRGWSYLGQLCHLLC